MFGISNSKTTNNYTSTINTDNRRVLGDGAISAEGNAAVAITSVQSTVNTVNNTLSNASTLNLQGMSGGSLNLDGWGSVPSFMTIPDQNIGNVSSGAPVSAGGAAPVGASGGVVGQVLGGVNPLLIGALVLAVVLLKRKAA